MPTRSGWAVLCLGATTLAAGRVFGFVELFLIGTALMALALIALAFVNLAPLRLEIARAVRPARVHAGQPCQVVLTLRNDGNRRTPVLGLSDAVRGSADARLLAAPLERGARSSAAYRLPTSRRGKLHIGPLRVELSDAFGLARTTVEAVGRTTVTVYPPIVPLAPPPRRGGADPHGRRSRGLHEGDEFHSLRPYVVGDDPRRVHWPATARRDELTVRQLDRRRHGRTTVLLDTRLDLHTERTFEVAVTCAASILVAAHARGDELHLLSTGGHDSGIDDDDNHLDATLSWLAVAEALTGVGRTAETTGRHGSPIRITTDREGALSVPASRRSGGLTIAVTEAETAAPPVAGLVRIRTAEDLIGAWRA